MPRRWNRGPSRRSATVGASRHFSVLQPMTTPTGDHHDAGHGPGTFRGTPPRVDNAPFHSAVDVTAGACPRPRPRPPGGRVDRPQPCTASRPFTDSGCLRPVRGDGAPAGFSLLGDWFPDEFGNVDDDVGAVPVRVVRRADLAPAARSSTSLRRSSNPLTSSASPIGTVAETRSAWTSVTTSWTASASLLRAPAGRCPVSV